MAEPTGAQLEKARAIANDCATFEHQDECERRIAQALAEASTPTQDENSQCKVTVSVKSRLGDEATGNK